MSNADTLKELEGKLNFFRIPKFLTFYVEDWFQNRDQLINKITKVFKKETSFTIRSSEFNIPAVIECGEQIYFSFKNSKKIPLDCSAKVIKIIC